MAPVFYIGILLFSAALCVHSCKLIFRPEQHWRDTVKKMGVDALGDLEKQPPLGLFRVIGIIGAATTGTASCFLGVILWQRFW